MSTEPGARATAQFALDLAPEHCHGPLVSPQQTIDVLVVEHVHLGVCGADDRLRVASHAKDQLYVTCNYRVSIVTFRRRAATSCSLHNMRENVRKN